MNYCDLKSIWYGCIWIPCILYLFLSGYAIHNSQLIISKQFCILIVFCLAVFLRIIWFFHFEDCVNLYGILGNNILLRIPQVIWLDLYMCLMLIWDSRLKTTILGGSINYWIHLMVIITSIIFSIIVFVLLFLQDYLANNIFLMVWTILVLAIGVYLGISTINVLRQLMPTDVKQDDRRAVALNKTKNILLASSFATFGLLLLNCIRYLANWSQGSVGYFIFIMCIHLMCEPIIVCTQYYAFFF